MSKPISQREARSLRKRVQKYEDDERTRLARWRSSYPGGVNIRTLTLDAVSAAVVGTAMSLEHAIVAKLDGNELYLYAVRVKP